MSYTISDAITAIQTLQRSHDLLLATLKETVEWMDEYDYSPGEPILDRWRDVIALAEQT